MSTEPKTQDPISEQIRKMHRKLAVDCFNNTWTLLDNTDRTDAEDFMMINTAHASRYHWDQIGTPLEFARGDWQISRVYATLGLGDAAFRYAKSSLDYCLEGGIGDFDLAFAYEAMARACACLMDESNREKYIQLATEAGEAIQKDGDKTYFFKELETI